MARRVAINGFGLLLGSMVLGPYVLEFFGIQLAVVRIAGGLVVTSLGWKMLTQEGHASHADAAELQANRGKNIGSFYPLTMPLTVGPGSMSVAITIGSGSGTLAYAILNGSQSESGGSGDCRNRSPRDRGTARTRRHRPVDLLRVPFCRHRGQPAGQHRAGRAGAPVGIHPHVPRHRDPLERLPHADRSRQLTGVQACRRASRSCYPGDETSGIGAACPCRSVIQGQVCRGPDSFPRPRGKNGREPAGAASETVPHHGNVLGVGKISASITTRL